MEKKREMRDENEIVISELLIADLLSIHFISEDALHIHQNRV